ncbi:uncharacterized protein LOC134817069 isoform X4 [Bolinopsis microptera]|uniref:uncharacterized protein LOC134817069 isoform X4 n=1 Tax=Bolinopsis microptera TaxID=2820187 RepID=UPI00307AACAE
MPFLTLRRFRLRKKPDDRKRTGYTPEEDLPPVDNPDPLTFSVMNLVSKPKRISSVNLRRGSELNVNEKKEKIAVYNKLKPDDPDKVVDIESQDEQVGYEFSTTQIKEFRKVFNAFDRDGNDSIGTEELGPVLNALGYSPSDLDIQKVLSRFDADHSGDLSFEEYLALMAVWVEEDETQIIEAFKVFDKSGDGFVTITELKRALCRFGEKFSEEEADEFFALIDVNKDGIINYEEFVKYMLSEINRGPPPRQVKT